MVSIWSCVARFQAQQMQEWGGAGSLIAAAVLARLMSLGPGLCDRESLWPKGPGMLLAPPDSVPRVPGCFFRVLGF